MHFSLFIGLLLIGSIYPHCTENECKACDSVCLSTRVTLCFDDFMYLKEHNQWPKDVYIIGNGDCSVNFSKECLCCYEYPHSVVCGTDDITYYNICELKCVAQTNYGYFAHLQLAYMGPCRDTSPKP
jgi:hypothetical protein